MTTTRWLCVPAGPYSVNLVPVGADAAGPDVFVKAAELDRLRAENETLRVSQMPLRKLGARLADLLNEDHWAECEALLLAAGVTPNAAAKAQPAEASD